MVRLLQEAFYLGGSVALVWLVLLPAVILLVVCAVYILSLIHISEPTRP